MKTFINGIGSVLIAGLCFIGARAVVQNIFESTENRNEITDLNVVRQGASQNGIPPTYFDVVRQEATQSGALPVAAEKVIGQMQSLIDSGNLSELEVAYGGITGTELQIRQKLNADLQRKEIVGEALVRIILQSSDLPMQLDEVTILTGMNYEVESGAVVYHYTITKDFSSMPVSFFEELRVELDNLNPDAACKTSLGLLKQGFDMIYSYRNEAGEELFRVIRSYERCQAIGFS